MTPKERIAELRGELAGNPSSRQFYQLGELLRRDGELAEAVKVLRQGLTHHPRYVAAWVSLGRALLDLQELGEAREAFRRALDLDPQNPVAWRLMAETLLGLNLRSQALAAFEQALTLVPGDEVLASAVASLKAELAEPAPGSLGALQATADAPTQAPFAPPELPPVLPETGEAAQAPAGSAAATFLEEPFAVAFHELPAAGRQEPGGLWEPFGDFLASPPPPPGDLFPLGDVLEAGPETGLGEVFSPPLQEGQGFPAQALPPRQPSAPVLAPASVEEKAPEPLPAALAAPPAPAGEPPGAWGAVVAAEEAAPKPSGPSLAEARAAVNRGELVAAVAMLEALVQSEPDNQEAVDLLALVRDMMEPLPPEEPKLSPRERKIAALQRYLANLTLARERLGL